MIEKITNKLKEINKDFELDMLVETNDFYIAIVTINGESLVGGGNFKISKDFKSIDYFNIPPISNLELLRRGKILYQVKNQ